MNRIKDFEKITALYDHIPKWAAYFVVALYVFGLLCICFGNIFARLFF